MKRSRALRLLLVFALVGTLLVGAGTGSPPPERLCGICTDELGESAEDNGVSAYGEQSSLHVQVFENGSSLWTERVQIQDAPAARLRNNSTLRDSIVADARNYRHTLVDTDSFTTAVEGDDLIARYRVDNVTTQGLNGVVLFDYLHREPGGGYYRTADEIVISGPEGTVVTNQPPGATVRNGSAVWSGDADSEPTASTYVAFGPDGGLLTEAATAGTIALDIGPTMLSDALVGSAPFVVVSAVLAAVLLLVDQWGARRWTPELVGLFVRGTGIAYSIGTAVVVVIVWPRLITLVPLAVVFSVFGALLWGAQQVAGASTRDEPRRLAPLLLGIGVLSVGVVAVTRPWLFGLPAGVALFWVALGAATSTRERLAGLAGVVLAPVALVFPMTPVGGFGTGFVAVFLGVAGVVLAPLGVLLYLLGRFAATREMGGQNGDGRVPDPGSSAAESPDRT